MPKHPMRTYKNLALIAGTLMANKELEEYFKSKSEILTASSLSKNAKLIELSVVQKREIGKPDGRKEVKENKGWFRRRKKEESEL